MIKMLLLLVGVHGVPTVIVELKETFPTTTACELSVATASKLVMDQINENFGTGSFEVTGHVCKPNGDPA